MNEDSSLIVHYSTLILSHLYKIFFLLFLCINLQGQTPHFRNHPFPAKYKNALVNTILETQDGFLWLGTSEGLFRYDGMEFSCISLRDSLLVGEVTALFEDSQQKIWVGTKTGNIYFLENHKSLQPWEIEEGNPAQKITGFEETTDGVLWISTYGEGVYYFKDGRLYQLGKEDGILGLEIYSMIQHREHSVLLATDLGISICSIKDGQKKIHSLTTEDGLSDEIIKTLLGGENDNFWAGTYDSGVDFWDAKNQTFQSLIPDWKYGEINQLAFFQGKELWIGTNGNGLFRYNFISKKLQKIDLPIFKDSKIYDLHKDVEGNLWVLNNKVGVSSANGQFEQVEHPLDNVQAVLVDQQNTVWLGTSNGLFKVKYLQDGQQKLQSIFPRKNIISLFEDVHGMIWIGTFGQGLYCLTAEQAAHESRPQKLKHFSKEHELSNDNILSIDGSEEMIWLATLGGAYELDISKKIDYAKVLFRNYTHEDGLGTNFIYKTFVDSKNRTWFGTDGKGISVLENGKILNYQEANGVPLKAVYNITEDHQGHIWLSTAEQGIFKFDEKKFSQFIFQNTRDIEITSMITDDLGNILIVRPTGIDVLNPTTEQLTYYDKEVGLENLEPVLNAVGKDKNGNIWIGAKNKLIRYSALNEALETRPRTQIKRVNVFFKPIDHQNIKSFSHKQNDLVFDYIGLWFSAPEKVEYRYQLEGYNPDWVYSKDTRAHYSNLPPGNYVFKVMSTDNGIFTSTPIASYIFEIKVPFWQQTWLLVLVILSLLILLYAWVKWKSQRIQSAADLQKERIQSQLEVLKSQISPHFLFNNFNILIALIEDEPETAAEYAEKLSDFYRNLLQYREKDLIPLQEELKLLRNFEFLLKKRFGDDIHLDIPNINGRTAFIPPLTLQMLVENAIKHNVISKRRPLKIKLEVIDDKISITNNLQNKLTKEKSTHFGLQSIQSRYELLGKRGIQIEETEKEFKVTIPILDATS